MATKSSYQLLLTRGLVANAPLEVLEGALPQLLEKFDGTVLEGLYRRLGERTDAGKLMVKLLEGCSAAFEWQIAQQGKLQPEALQHLASSKRIRTLQALADRDDLTPTVAAKLAHHPHEGVRHRARQSGALPSSERISILEEGDHTLLRLWCSQDPEVLVWLLARALRFLDGETIPHYPHSRRVLGLVPGGDLPEDALQPLRKILTRMLTDRNFGEILSYSRSNPRGKALAVLLEVLAAPDSDERRALLHDVARQHLAPVFGSQVRTRKGGFIARWADPSPESLTAAYRAGVESRNWALAHPNLPAELRAEAVASDDPKDLYVAMNFSLTPDEVDTLLGKLAPSNRWWLVGAELNPEQTFRILEGGPALYHVVRLAGPEMSSRLRRWTSPEVLGYILENRTRILGDDARAASFVLGAALEHPELREDLLKALRPEDALPGSAETMMFEQFTSNITTPEQAVTFATLLPEWQGSVAELLDAAGMLGQ